MSKRTKLTEKEFKKIKHLLSSGVSHKKVARISGRAQSTLSYINRSSSLEEYRKLIIKLRGKTSNITSTRNVTAEEFEKIKTLSKFGLKRKQIVEISGRSMSIVALICPAKNFADYKRVMRERIVKKVKKQEVVKKVVVKAKTGSKMPETSHLEALLRELISTTRDNTKVMGAFNNTILTATRQNRDGSITMFGKKVKF